jgi:probable rRNA maturation factor
MARAIAAALDAAGAPSPASIGLIFSDDAELEALNRDHLEADGPTDVLSFPLLPPEAFPAHRSARRRGPAPRGGSTPRRGSAPPDGSAAQARPFALPPGRRVHLGDIVISVERAAAQAAAGRGGQTGNVRWSASDELRLLAVHGTLHICGWDHADPAEEREMRELEQRLLASPGVLAASTGAR